VADGASAADWPLRLGGGFGWDLWSGNCMHCHDSRRPTAPRTWRFRPRQRGPCRPLSPLLGWGDADLVYVTYGKIWSPLFLAFTLCAFLVYQQRRPGLWETWVWRVTLDRVRAGLRGRLFGLLDPVDWQLQRAVPGGLDSDRPGLLLTMLGSTVLGITLLVRGSTPRLPALLLALVIPLAWLILQATSPGQCGAPGDVRLRDPRASAGFGF
jgi:hypothetical protein